MLNFLRSVIGSMWPPSPQDTESRHHEWRISISTTMIIIMMVVGVFISYSEGIFPRGYGFAKSYDLQEVQDTISDLDNNIRATQEIVLETQLMTMRERQCRAMAEDETNVKSLATQWLNTYSLKYKIITGREWRIPDCNEIM